MRIDATARHRSLVTVSAAFLGAALLLGSGWSMPGVVGLCGLVTVVVAGACTRLTPGPHAH